MVILLKTQETSLYPALHSEFNIKVQNNIYTALNTNNKNVFGISHSNAPKQYLVVLPKFCIAIIININTDKNK